jgi:Tfp pilus assembly protein PilF
MHPDKIRQTIDEALAALRQGDDVRAVALTDQLATALPGDPVVRAMRAQALLSGETADEAFEEARRAVELDDDNEYAQRLLGLAAWRAERLSVAQRALERAVELSGRRPEILADYAWFMASQRGPKLAMNAAREAVEADENSSTAWAAMGLTEWRLRRRREAETSLRRALRLNPNDLYAQSAMLVLLQDKRQDAQAEALAELLQDIPGTEDLIESVRSEAKRRRVAGILVERNLAHEPERPDAWRQLIVWLIAIPAVVGVVFWIFQPDRLAGVVAVVLALLFVVWRLGRLLD